MKFPTDYFSAELFNYSDNDRANHGRNLNDREWPARFQVGGHLIVNILSTLPRLRGFLLRSLMTKGTPINFNIQPQSA